MSDLHAPVLAWYSEHARDLPWRRPDAGAWSVMVSEFMLQQTPVSRVLPVHGAWLERWPSPADLAAESAGEAVRAWGRLGYPRRALRLHAAATVIERDHEGRVPDSYAALLALPGVGDYTAAAIASFAFGQRHVVLDTNVRRVLARVLQAREFAGLSPTRTERDLAHSVLPESGSTASTWSVAVMELGALVCTSARPSCEVCPVARECRWRLAGFPTYDGPARPAQAWAGTDRQCRGRLMAVVREADGAVHHSRLEAAWDPAAQRDRCLQSLLDDGLLIRTSSVTVGLP